MFESPQIQSFYWPNLNGLIDAAGTAALAEAQILCNEAQTPFLDGAILMRGPSDAKRYYAIKNNGICITVSRADHPDFECWYPSSKRFDRLFGIDPFVSDAISMPEEYPALQPLYKVETDENNKVTSVEMPTLSTMYLAQLALFRGLQTANIRLVQSTNPGSVDALPFVNNLYRNIFTVSAGIGIHDYPHDCDIHWLGSASLHAVDFAAWRMLYVYRDYIVGADDNTFIRKRNKYIYENENSNDYDSDIQRGHDSSQQFINSLASGFDISTGSVLDVSHVRNRVNTNQEYLLAATLRQIERRCPNNILQRSIAVIRSLGIGETQISQQDNATYYKVPWEIKNLSAHYNEVYRRLGIII